jgi:hypothetical protein
VLITTQIGSYRQYPSRSPSSVPTSLSQARPAHRAGATATQARRLRRMSKDTPGSERATRRDDLPGASLLQRRPLAFVRIRPCLHRIPNHHAGRVMSDHARSGYVRSAPFHASRGVRDGSWSVVSSESRAHDPRRRRHTPCAIRAGRGFTLDRVCGRLPAHRRWLALDLGHRRPVQQGRVPREQPRVVKPEHLGLDRDHRRRLAGHRRLHGLRAALRGGNGSRACWPSWASSCPSCRSAPIRSGPSS